MREIKFFTHHPDDPKLNVKSSYNRKNHAAPDKYYKGWGQMRDMRYLWSLFKYFVWIILIKFMQETQRDTQKLFDNFG